MKAHNPILPGFYPDPSICRVGEDYYLVNSTFNYFPGVPIFHSKDLTHWHQIGNILEREEQLDVSADTGTGIYAPTIRFHEGIYYMITTNMYKGGNFIVTATNPAGPWSAPYFLGEEEAPGFDPSLFFDEDGKCYYVGTRPNPETYRYTGDMEIWVQEVDLETMKLTGESKAIWKGALKQAIWPEGPHLYKKDGYYYLLIAEGGTAEEHSICVARSKELFAWFEGCRRNPIFTHRNLGKNYPVVYTGHGDLVDDVNGNWYIVMLASRPCKGKCSMGRETFLAKVEWEDGWPVINPGIGKLEDEVELPFEDNGETTTLDDVMKFDDEELDQRFLGIRKRSNEIYSLTDRPGYLRLFTRPERLEEDCYPSYLGLRQKENRFTATTKLEFAPESKKECAGLVIFQSIKNHLIVEVVKGAIRIRKVVDGEEKILASLETEKSEFEIEIQAENQLAAVYINKTLFADKIDLLPYTTEAAGGFVGCTIGVYTSSNGEKSTNHCDVKKLSITY